MKMIKYLLKFIFQYDYRGYIFGRCLHFGGIIRLFCSWRLKHRGVIINRKAIIKGKLFMFHPVSIVIGANVVIEDQVTIYQNVTLGKKNNGYPKIGKNVVIYPNSCIVGSVSIGESSIVGACSFVDKTIPANSIFFNGTIKNDRSKNE